MSHSSPPTTLFGLPLAPRRADARQLVEALIALWERQMRRPPAGLEGDLDALRTFFNPLASGGRLRALLAELPPAPVAQARLLAPPLVLGDEHDRLITPEGRVALEVLRDLLAESDEDPLVVDADSVYTAEHAVYRRYRQWGLGRIEGVLALRAGKAEALRLPSIGLLLLLLVNGSRSPETALHSPSDDPRKERVDGAVSAIVAAFCGALDERVRDPRHFVLYSGYPLTEARRRLPEALPAAGRAVYLAPGTEERTLARIAAELRRPQRSYPIPRVLEAYDRLVAAYRQELPVLAALGMAFEQRAETRRIRQRLEALLGDYQASA